MQKKVFMNYNTHQKMFGSEPNVLFTLTEPLQVRQLTEPNLEHCVRVRVTVRTLFRIFAGTGPRPVFA